MARAFVVGTRGSLLARTQTGWVIGRLRQGRPDLTITERVIFTSGDRQTQGPLSAVGGKGLFTRELEDALLNGEIDLAVHSMKDLPGQLPAGLIVGAVPAREDPRDAWVAATVAPRDDRRPSLAPTLKSLPAGAVVGTTSLRRAAQVRALRPDLAVTALRGNIDTRLAKVASGQVAATLLAVAGLNRAGLAAHITEALDPTVMVPAAGQGALAIETRADDPTVAALIAEIHDISAAHETAAERAIVAALGGNCNAPIGVHAQVRGHMLSLRAVVLSLDGQRRAMAEGQAPLPETEALIAAVVATLRAGGAAELMAQAATQVIGHAPPRSPTADPVPPVSGL